MIGVFSPDGKWQGDIVEEQKPLQSVSRPPATSPPLHPEFPLPEFGVNVPRYLIT